MNETLCPGCGLRMPLTNKPYDGYFNASPECWSVFTEVAGAEFSNVVLFSQAHQLTVDAYATQHAGGPHPDKSIAVHLSGLHLFYEEGVKPTSIAPLLQKLATRTNQWPHFDPPEVRGSMTIFDVALAESHIDAVRAWSRGVWESWSPHHAAIAELVRNSSVNIDVNRDFRK